MNEVIELLNVSKSFGSEMVLKPTTMSFEKGKIYGICGRNGSGKTVLLKLMAGFLKTDTGIVRVLGKQIGKECDFAEEIGVLIEHPGFLKSKSGFQNLKCLAEIRNQIKEEEVRQAMEAVGLNWKDRKWVGRYSMGMCQRLGIAQAIMEKPELLLLDEPVNGLDAEGTETIHNLLREFRDSGKTVLLVSHLKDDLEGLCDKVYKLTEGIISE